MQARTFAAASLSAFDADDAGVTRRLLDEQVENLYARIPVSPDQPL